MSARNPAQQRESFVCVNALFEARRFNTRPCPDCGVVTSLLGLNGRRVANMPDTCDVDGVAHPITHHGNIVTTCRGCGIPTTALKVVGKLVAHKKCDERCTSARGHKCECACGGVNHGAEAA